MIASLQRREPVRPERGRNPFAFAQPPATYLRPDQLPPLPSAAGLPELPMPLPRPSVKLLGIAAGRETPPVRTAVLSVGGDLVLAHVGDVIAAQYRVVAISEDGIELADAAGQQHLRMALR